MNTFTQSALARKILFPSIALASLLVLSACGGNDAGTDTVACSGKFFMENKYYSITASYTNKNDFPVQVTAVVAKTASGEIIDGINDGYMKITKQGYALAGQSTLFDWYNEASADVLSGAKKAEACDIMWVRDDNNDHFSQ